MTPRTDLEPVFMTHDDEPATRDDDMILLMLCVLLSWGFVVAVGALILMLVRAI